MALGSQHSCLLLGRVGCPPLAPHLVLLGAAIATSLFLGCTRVRVETRLEPGVDFAGVATYELALPPGEHAGAPRYTMALGEEINQEIARQLDAKGYRAVGESGDVRVSFRVRGTPRTRVVNAGDADVDFYVEEDFVVGAMAIDVKDPRSGRKLWVGVGEVDLYSQTNKTNAAMATVRAILAELPARE